MWFRNFKIAKELYIDIIGSLLQMAPVHFVFNPSNHDYTHGFFLADMIETYFSNHDGFTADANLQHRKYYKYGQNLIGTTHGDGAKNQDLPLLMATEAKVSSWQRVPARNREKWSGPTHNIRHRVDALGCCSRGNDPSILALGRENDIRHRAEEVFENLAKKQG